MAARRSARRTGGNKQRLCGEIAHVISRPVRLVSEGYTEPKQTLIDIVEALELPISADVKKPWLAQAIVEFAGLRWEPEYDSRHTPSGGGDNIKVAGLECVFRAVLLLKQMRRASRRSGAIAPEGGAVRSIRLRKASTSPSKALAEDAFAERGDPMRRKLLLEKALAGHRELLVDLLGKFRLHGYDCRDDPRSVDLLASRRGCHVLIEVKTVAASPVTVVRTGLSQLFEYAYRLRREFDAPVLVLAVDRPIRSPTWLVAYVTEDRGVNLLWREGKSLRIRGPHDSLLRGLLTR